jgi:hypothetical protein
MIKHQSKDTSFFILLFLGVLISRVPFIEYGFGIDPDSWRVANVANAISATKQYVASRLPGYPVQEITYALLPIKSAAVFNLFTAFLSSLCVLYFAKFIKLLGIKHYIYPSVAFAFVPIIYINSTNSMDYIWALCFIVISFYFAISQKIFLSGIFIGMAAGCRITSAGMLLPLFVLVQSSSANKLHRNFGKLLSGFLTTFVIAFLPVVLTYGLRFFSFSSGNVPILYIVKSFTIDVWGILGFLSLGFYSLFLLLRLFGRQQFRVFISDTINQLSLLVIALYVIAFAFAPYDPGYLIPIVPFIIILFTHNLSARQSFIYCFMIVLSSFALGVNASDMPWRVEQSSFSYIVAIGQRPIEINLIRGPIIEDRLQRIARATYINKVIDFITTVEKNSVLVSGIWFTQLAVELNKSIKDNIEEFNSFEHKNVVVCDAMDNKMASRYREQNFSIYYLTGQDKSNFGLYGFYLRDMGANEVIFRE